MEAAEIKAEIDWQFDSLQRSWFTPVQICLSLPAYRALVPLIIDDSRTRVDVGVIPTHYRDCEFVILQTTGIIRVMPSPSEVIHRNAALAEWRAANLPSPTLAGLDRHEARANRRNLERGYRRACNRVVMEVLTELNGGRIPASLEDFVSIARKLTIRFAQSPPGVSEPEAAYDTELAKGYIILPRCDSSNDLLRWLIHEISECAMKWEGAEQFAYPASLGDHHDIAMIVERVYRRLILQNRPDVKIPRC